MGIPAIMGVIAGALLSKYVASSILETALAVFLVLLSVVMLIFRNLSLKPVTSVAAGGGVLSGFLAGLLGTGGAVRGIVLAAFRLPVKTFIATSAIIDMGIDMSRSIVYYTNGYMHADDMYLVPILLVVSILGSYAGKRILEHVSEERFRTLTLFLVLLTGLVTLYKQIS